VRQADTRLGEVVCVVGLGLVGQLTAQLLRAAGARVICADLAPERVARASAAGFDCAVSATDEELAATVRSLTADRGADAVLIAAATPSSAPVRQAVELLRRRGRVVVVGAVGLDIDREAFYRKDAELRIACSYGPGRHDPAYEVEGRDYPYDFVRWTENRNMAEFLRLVATGHIEVAPLIDLRFPIARADEAYAAATGAEREKVLGVLLEYPQAGAERPVERRVEVLPQKRPGSAVGFALVGPGSFAREVHLPNLAALAPGATLRAVVGRTGHPAVEAARRFAAAYATTDLEEVLRDEEVRALLICTRHDAHADIAARALAAGKAVYLEKPAAITPAGLSCLAEAVVGSGSPFTLGFNRRFAPAALRLVELLASRKGPLVLDYRVNAGRLPRGHWLLGPAGGGRLIGEACHMVDLMGHLVASPRESHALCATALGDDLPRGDNFVLACRHADGSLATLCYTALGQPAVGKERIECHWDGRTAVLDDFRSLVVDGAPAGAWDGGDKGHRALLAAFVRHVTGEGPAPIPWEEIHAVSRLILDLDGEVRGGAR
jgi:predicted dehydrogenase